jgi:hypothetical protein
MGEHFKLTPSIPLSLKEKEGEAVEKYTSSEIILFKLRRYINREVFFQKPLFC